MAAAAYKVTMVCALGSPNGERKMFSLTASDVNAEYWLHASGSSDVVLHGTKDVYIVDTILSASGTDTSNVDYYINGQPSNVRVYNATSLATTIGRPFQNAPLKIPAGAMLKVKQNT